MPQSLLMEILMELRYSYHHKTLSAIEENSGTIHQCFNSSVFFFNTAADFLPNIKSGHFNLKLWPCSSNVNSCVMDTNSWAIARCISSLKTTHNQWHLCFMGVQPQGLLLKSCPSEFTASSQQLRQWHITGTGSTLLHLWSPEKNKKTTGLLY